jgi:hypothetical protein
MPSDTCTLSVAPHLSRRACPSLLNHRYHANNAKILAKTTLEGEVVWIKDGPFGQDMACGPDMCPANSCKCPAGQAPYIPTW